jgi:hypothetical protein
LDEALRVQVGDSIFLEEKVWEERLMEGDRDFMMNIVQKAAFFLLKPRRWRLFSRLDLIFLLLVVGLVVVHLGISSFLSPAPVFAATHNQLSATCDPAIEECGTANTNPTQQQIKNPIADNLNLVFYTDPKLTIRAKPVQQLWNASLIVVDTFIVLVLILEGLRIMLAGSVFRYANAVEALPGILLALVAAHLSMSFMGMMLDTNNTLAKGFYVVAEGTQRIPGEIQTKGDCGDGITRAFDWFSGLVLPGVNFDSAQQGWNANCKVQNANNQAQNPQADTLNPDTFIDPIEAFQSMDKLLQFSLQLMGIMLLIQLIIRILLLNIYIVFAPIGIAAWALPGRTGQGLTRLWFKGFLSTALVQIAQVAAICIGQLVIVGIGSAIQPALYHGVVVSHPGAQNPNQTVYTDTVGKMDPKYFILILQLAMGWFVFRIPALLGTAPMGMMISVGESMGQTFAGAFQSNMTQWMRFTASVGASVTSGQISGLLSRI